MRDEIVEIGLGVVVEVVIVIVIVIRKHLFGWWTGHFICLTV